MKTKKQQWVALRRLHYLGLMAAAQVPAEVVRTAQAYLGAWPAETVERLQQIDAGWAPFDTAGRPVQIDGATHLRCIRDAVHSHCMALREAGFAPTPELAELEEFFYVANRRAEATAPAAPRLAARRLSVAV
jgi:hypothetical protein